MKLATASVTSRHPTYCDCTSDMKTCAPGRDVVNCASSTSAGKGSYLAFVSTLFVNIIHVAIVIILTVILTVLEDNSLCPHQCIFSTIIVHIIHCSHLSIPHHHLFFTFTVLIINCHYQLLPHYHNPQPTYSTHNALP